MKGKSMKPMLRGGGGGEGDRKVERDGVIGAEDRGGEGIERSRQYNKAYSDVEQLNFRPKGF